MKLSIHSHKLRYLQRENVDAAFHDEHPNAVSERHSRGGKIWSYSPMIRGVMPTVLVES